MYKKEFMSNGAEHAAV